MNREESLIKWIETLNENQKNKIILNLIEYAIDSEYVSFWEHSKKPRYDCNGEFVDGTE